MMSSFSGSSKIIELKEKLAPVHTNKGIPPSKSNSRLDDGNQKSPVLTLHDAIENDINRLFQAIHTKNSVKSLGQSYQEGVGPSRKNAMKKPIKLGVSYGTEISEQLNLKQALRGLSISQASETAASKWLSQSVNSPRISEAGGRIKNLYKSVVVEPGQSSKRGKGIVQKNITSEATTSGRCEKVPHFPHDSKTKSLNRSANSSPRLVKSPVTKGERRPLSKKEMNPVFTKSGNFTLKEMMAEPENHEKIEAHTSKVSKNKLVATQSLASSKLVNKVPNSKVAKKSPSQTVASPATPISEHKLNKVTTKSPRSVTPVRSKNLAKKSLKPELLSVSGTYDANYDVRNAKDPANSSLVCQNCQCLLQSTDSKPDQSSQALNCSSADAEVGLSWEMKPGTGSQLSSSSGCNSSAAVPKANNTSKLKGKGGFSQSSKSSIGELSSSTSISEESYLSGSSRGNRPHKSKDVRWEALGQVQRMHGTLGLKNFNLLKKLGYGDIGTVYLAELIGTNCPFAIKVMDIEYLSRRKKTPRAEAEREILKMLDHPFLPTLYAQFTSDNLSCLVMEYCPGGDLHVLRQKQTGRNFPEHAARFYVAEVLLAMEYLHMLGIIYRDLKPENILVREDGHIMLTDFDLSLRCDVVPTLMESSSYRSECAKGQCTGASCIHPFCIEPSCRVPCFTPRILPAVAKARKQKHDHALLLKSLPQLVAEPTDARSNSFVGTHEYLAPEIIRGEGHGSAVDWWTFGVFLFELLYGKTPFRGSGNDETLTNVVTQSLKFPDTPFVSFQARDLIKGLLVKEPENRLGSKRGAAEIKQHPFFDGLNWALIRCTAPPELPDFYDCNYGVLNSASTQENKSKFLEFKTTEEHLEFELF